MGTGTAELKKLSAISLLRSQKLFPPKPLAIHFLRSGFAVISHPGPAARPRRARQVLPGPIIIYRISTSS